MSRTKKGKRSPGSEYWGKRPLVDPGHSGKGKQLGIQRERANLKQELLDKINEQIKIDEQKSFDNMVERMRLERMFRF